jgi:hypothetical protein
VVEDQLSSTASSLQIRAVIRLLASGPADQTAAKAERPFA